MPKRHIFRMWQPGEYARWRRWRGAVAYYETGRTYKLRGRGKWYSGICLELDAVVKVMRYHRNKHPNTRFRMMGRGPKQRRMRAEVAMLRRCGTLDKRFNF